MKACKEGTAEALFNNINSILRRNKVDWKICVAVGLDNTAVNIRKKNSIMTLVLVKNKNIFVNGCPYHIIHNTTNKSAERFLEVSGFDVKNFLVDLFHWFDKSSKRKVTVNYWFSSLLFKYFVFFINQLQYICILCLSMTLSSKIF